MTDNGAPVPRPAWSLPSPRRVLLAIGIFTLLSVIGGGVYQHFHRNDKICRDRRAPVSQRSYGIGQIQYRCHNGQIVTKP